MFVAASAAETSASAEEIIVTATRQPTPRHEVIAATQVVTQDDIERWQPKDLGSLLGRLSGIGFRDSGGRGSVSGVFIRGAAPTQTVILIDGIRSASATVGATALENIPIESIERIEVVKGPLSSIYGADAVGGVIQIFTKRGRAQRLTPQIHLSYRSDDTQEYSAELSGGNARGGFHATFAHENAAGIDRTTIQTGGNHDRDGYDEFTFNVSANYNLSEALEARLALLRTDGHSEFDNTFGADTGFDSDTRVENNSLKLIYTPLDKLRLTLDAGHFIDEIESPVFFTDLKTRRTSVYLQSDFQLHSDHSLSLGFDYYDDKVSGATAFTQTSRDNIGGLLSWQGRYAALRTVASVRHDANEAYGDDTNGSIALEYSFSPRLAAVLSFGTAFRAPSFNDLFFPGFGNPDVQPEESESVEVGLKGRHHGTEWRVSAYHTEVKDLIGFDAATFTANNTANATLQGIELELARQFGAWQVNANLDYLDARDETIDEYLPDRAEFSANLDVHRSFGQFDITFDLQAESGRHDVGGRALSGFVIFGAGANYHLTRTVRLAGRLDNVFDEDYTLKLVNANDAFRTYGRTLMLSLHAAY